MKTVTVRELRTDFPRLEALLKEGEAIAITKHKRLVATLSEPAVPAQPDFARRFGSTGNSKTNSRERSVLTLLEDDRGT